MKKVLKLLLLSIIFIIILFLKNEHAVSDFILGDINDDFIVDSKDMMLISNHISAVKSNSNKEKVLTGAKLDAADINRDGEVKPGDVLIMLRYLTIKSNPYNIGTKFEATTNSIDKENDLIVKDTNTEVKNIDLKDAVSTQSNQEFGKDQIEYNIMEQKLASSDKIRFEKETIQIKTFEVEKLKVISENNDEPIKITTSDMNIVELYGVGIAVGKNPGEAIITAEQGNEKAQCKVRVVDRNEAVYKIEIDKKELNLETGETAKIEAKTEPGNREIQWTTSNKEIVEVKEDGTVISKKAGIAGVYAISGSQRATCVVRVKDKEVEVEEVGIEKSEIELTQGDVGNIKVGITPRDATIREIEIIQENDNIKIEENKVTVNEEGIAEIKIEAKKAGTTTISVKAGEKEARAKITIKEAEVEKLTLDTSEIKMEENQLRRITAKIEPEIASSKTIKWTSDNNEVAKVDENGLVTSVKSGEANITATIGEKSATCKVTVEKTKVSVREIKISQNITVKEDQEIKIPVELVPANATNKEVNVKIDNENATIESEKVTVNKEGKAEIKITGKKIGNSVLTVSSGVIVEKCNVTIIPKVIPVSKITMSATEVTIDKGKSHKITVKIEPTNATNKEITLKVSNANISVDKTKITTGNDGTAQITIAGNKEGNTVLTATAGEKSVKCNVKVNAVVENISISETNIKLEAGKKKKLKVSITPLTAVNKKVTWSSSNSKVATVDSNGNVTGKADGVATITATAGSKSAKCKVTVAATKVELDRTILMIDNVHYNIADLEAKLSSTALYSGKDVTWTIDNSSIAKFKKGGKNYKTVKGGAAQVVGLKFGTTKITATLPNNKKATCKLKVITSSAEQSSGDRFVNWKHGNKWYPFYLRSGDWGKEYVEAYVNNAAKLVKKYADKAAFVNEAKRQEVWCYRQKSIKFDVDKKKKLVKGYTGNDHGVLTPMGHWDFEEILKIKKKGELSPNDYVLLFTSKNQYAYILHKNSKTGKWELLNSRRAAAGYNRDTFQGYLCIMKKENPLGIAVTYEKWGRGESSYQNAVHVDCGNIQGEPQSAGCIRVAYTREPMYYYVFYEAGVGTRLILF